jgi:hypothetical protein
MSSVLNVLDLPVKTLGRFFRAMDFVSIVPILIPPHHEANKSIEQFVDRKHFLIHRGSGSNFPFRLRARLKISPS